MSFFSYFIRISFNFNYFYFYLRISNFFYSSSRRCWSYDSMLWIFSCHPFSAYLRSLYNWLICYSTSEIISTVTMFWVLGFFAFFFDYSILCYISLIRLCFVMYCSWFFLRILSFSSSFSERTLHSYFSFDSCYFSFDIFYSYSPSFLITFNAFVCSFLIRINPYFYDCSCFNYFWRALSSSYFPWMPLLSYTCSSCLFVMKILFFNCMISICCFFSSTFFSLIA